MYRSAYTIHTAAGQPYTVQVLTQQRTIDAMGGARLFNGKRSPTTLALVARAGRFIQRIATFHRAPSWHAD
jgi:hypothetical protein